ncbi:MAG: peroxide stress protein YaaA [Cereibacter changlensis]|uniref:UPF0246 protein C5F48_04440 n=1 Tax=Cereibacter changlensis JA139 TaxID=1188249 RepID=A0A2T4JYF0_9RHOB|nr:peroxide stress protein YaaA [Cereibacter changlensis]PTE22934.1 peroxide stress protein YaaA [Cereibacter changlensis JA139]
MLTVLSPAKRLAEPPLALPEGLAPTRPAFTAEAAELAEVARGLTVAGLRKLMHISEPLAELNRDRFAAFDAADTPEAPAVALFDGDTYAGLEAKTLDADALRWAQGHLRILSGLYGLLRPLDAIRPYRLEMGSRLANPRGATLYDFWGDRVAEALNATAAETGSTVLINCASVEYFTAADRAALKLRVVTPTFLEDRGGERKIVSFWAKKARGAMARFIAENRLTEPEQIHGFTAGGYAHEPELSEPDRPVFLRQG